MIFRGSNFVYVSKYNFRHPGQPVWHNTEYIYGKSWLTLNKAQVPAKDLEVRLVASNRLGDTATSRTVAVTKSVKNMGKILPSKLVFNNDQV